ncbi:hypothetical protein BT69DRAFT_1323363 [Atractiella rhizophila]|nr:hypothetical protein BT69DRAFT_1323363 [Atractiella rhizophila]
MSDSHVRHLLSFFEGEKGKGFPWSDDVCRRIVKRREEMEDGRLFIDLLLEIAGVADYDVLYPPPSEAHLQTLLNQISSSTTFNVLKQDCLIYYLLLDLPPSSSTSPARAFASVRLLPPSWVKSMDGWHSLDSGSYKSAIRNLTDPLVRPDWVPKIYSILAGAAPGGAELVLTFWRLSGREKAEEPETVRIVIDAMVEVGEVEQAWDLGRRRDEGYISRILSASFGDNWTKKPFKKSVEKLVTLPMNEEEEAVVEQLCVNPTEGLRYERDGKNWKLLQDWWGMRLVEEGRFADALRFFHLLPPPPIPGEDPNRTHIMNSIEALLPSLQRSILSLSLNPPTPSDSPVMLSSTYDMTQQVWKPSNSPPATPSMTWKPPNNTPAAAPPTTSRNVPLSASPMFRAKEGGDAQRGLLRALAEQNVRMGRIGRGGDAMASPASTRKVREEDVLDLASPTPFKLGSPAVRQSPAFDSPLRSRIGSPAISRGSPFSFGHREESPMAPFSHSKPSTPTLAGLGTVPFVPFAVASQAAAASTIPSEAPLTSSVSPLKRNRDGTPVSSGNEAPEIRRQRSGAPEPLTPKVSKVLSQLKRQNTGKFLNEMKRGTSVRDLASTAAIANGKKSRIVAPPKKTNTITGPGGKAEKQVPGGWTDGALEAANVEEHEETMDREAPIEKVGTKRKARPPSSTATTSAAAMKRTTSNSSVKSTGGTKKET